MSEARKENRGSPASGRQGLSTSWALGFFLTGKCMVAAGITIVLIVLGGERVRLRSVEQIESRTMKAIGHSLDSFIDNHVVILKDLAKLPLISHSVMQPEARLADLYDMMGSITVLGHKHNMLLFDFEGKVIHSTDSVLEVSHIEDKWVQSMMSGEVPERIEIFDSEEERFCRIIVPVRYSQEIEGFLAVDLPVGLLHSGGMPSTLMENAQAEIFLEDALLGSFGPEVDSPWKTGFSPLYGFGVHFRISGDSMASGYEDIIGELILALVLVNFVSLWIAILASRRIFSKPLEKLRHVASLISETDIQPEVPKKQFLRELRELSQAFAGMRAKVHQREETLLQSQQQLEDRVKERTADLENEIVNRQRIEGHLRKNSDELKAAYKLQTAHHEQMTVHQEDLKTANKELLHAKQGAVEANHAKTQFLASMSHEIRTPLTALLGYLEILESDIPNLTTETRTYLGRLNHNAEHLLFLINDILDLSKIEANEMVVQQRSQPLYALVDDVQALMAPRAGKKDISLSIKCNGPLPERIVTDRVRLKQILLNLVSNAIKFTEVGEVTIALSLGDDSLDGDPMLDISVQDTGVGISEDCLPLLFQPFTQANANRDSELGGSGLGLDISRRLARILGGNITVETTLGVGSNFTFHHPLNLVVDLQPEDAIEPAHVQEISSTSLESISVLVADDNQDNRRIYELFLKAAGAEVTLAKDGLESVQMYREAERPFDIILMDMRMPRMDGYAATKKLRIMGATMPIIALTAHTMSGDAERCIEAGCSGYIGKPIEREQFLSSIKYELNQLRDQPHGLQEEDSQPSTPDPLIQLIKAYKLSLAGVAKELDELLSREDLPGLELCAHKLHGSAGSYGLPRVSQAAADVETAIRNSQPLEEINAATRMLLTEIETLLRSSKSKTKDKGVTTNS
ncbi:MAG TPA: response regulator [Planctomycetes bacterium]|nr:response regulator [Planctomycetota bacterium]HIL37335.1 response regulator [Planctomycetota bacterium]